MRDKLKDLDYFNNFIDKLYNSQDKRLDKFKRNQIKTDRIPSVKRDMFKNYLRIISAKYSRGDDMFSNQLKNDFSKKIQLISSSIKDIIDRECF